MHHYKFRDAMQAHDALLFQLASCSEPGKDYDYISGSEVALHDVMVECDSFDWNMNLKNYWLTSHRWTTMVRQYLNPNALDDCMNLVEDHLTSKGRRGIAVLRTNTVEGRGEGHGVRRRWGSCMLSLSFRVQPTPTIRLNSRTSYIGYLAAMDITVAHAFARECSELTGIPVEDMRFVWNLDQIQLHGFRCLAPFLADPEYKAQMDRDVDNRKDFPNKLVSGNTPGYRKLLDGYARILQSDRAGKLYADESFSSFARARRRFHSEVMGVEYAAQFEGGTRRDSGGNVMEPLPDLWSKDLDLSPLIR